jgi:hypothetical protein
MRGGLMRASMAMLAGRTRMRTTKIECALLVAVLAMFVPGFAHAETSGADAAKSGGQAAPPHAVHAKSNARPAPPSGKGAPRKTGLSPTVTSTTAASMQNRHAVTPAPHITTNPHAATGISRASGTAPSGTGASGNTAGRRASGVSVIGGPARYDAKHGAVIGGTVTGRKR